MGIETDFGFMNYADSGGGGSDPSAYFWRMGGITYDYVDLGALNEKGPEDYTGTISLVTDYGTDISTDLGNFNAADPVNSFGQGVVSYDEGFIENANLKEEIRPGPISYTINSIEVTKSEAKDLVISILEEEQKATLGLLQDTSYNDSTYAPSEGIYIEEKRVDGGYVRVEDAITGEKEWIQRPTPNQIVQQLVIQQAVIDLLQSNPRGFYLGYEDSDTVLFSPRRVTLQFDNIFDDVQKYDADRETFINAITSSERLVNSTLGTNVRVAPPGGG
jgi:hypothetical protein